MFGSLYSDVIGDGPNKENEKPEQAKEKMPTKETVLTEAQLAPACGDDGNKSDQ